MKALVFGVPPEPFEVPDDANAADPEPGAHTRRPARRAGSATAARRLGGHPAAADRHLRLGLQADPHGLRRGRRRQRDGGVLLVPPGDGPRGGRRRGRARPRGRGLEVGQRVVLNPWLSCGPRGIEPPLPRVRGRRLQPVLELHRRRHHARHPHRRVDRRDGRLRRADARARQHAVPGARRRCPTSSRCSPTRSRCRCTRSPATRRRRSGKVAGVRRRLARAVRGRDPAGALPRRRGGGGRALRRARPSWPRRLGAAKVLAHEPRLAVIEELAAWSAAAGCAQPLQGLPMAYPGGDRRRLRHRRQAARRSRSASACSRRAARS